MRLVGKQVGFLIFAVAILASALPIKPEKGLNPYYLGNQSEVHYLLIIIMVNYKRGTKIKILSLSKAKMKFSELVQAVYSTEGEIVITKDGRPAAVLVSPEEFESWKETIAIA